MILARRASNAVMRFSVRLMGAGRAFVCALALGTGCIIADESRLFPEDLSRREPAEAGRVMAETLRASVPTENADFKGVLKVRSAAGQTSAVPFTLQVRLDDSGWRAIYETTSTARTPAERLIIKHGSERPNEYFHARAARPGEPPGALQALSSAEAARSLADTDFWLCDLGLEFYHWPQQRHLRTEMRKSRVCYVLESVPPAANSAGYGRVLAWIDKEEGAPILAEAFDPAGKLLKEFSIRSFKKVEGRWQLQKMSIRNVQTRSRTWIEFDFERD